MIPIGCMCLIVHAPNLPEAIGRECTITHHDPELKQNHIAQLNDGHFVQGPQRCFLPLKPAPTIIVKAKKELSA